MGNGKGKGGKWRERNGWENIDKTQEKDGFLQTACVYLELTANFE
jgi:hypothetical protein